MTLSEQSKYSYQDCWNYIFSLQKKINISEIKNDLIILCQTTPENFWLNFNNKVLTFSAYSRFCYNLFKRFDNNYPVPYLINQTFFYGLPFYVEEGIFIPQKDTEILVERAKELIKQFWNKKTKLKILDIGTGCGNVAIALAKSKPNWNFTAIDVNENALRVAKLNAIKNKTTNIKFQKSDLFDNINSEEKFDVIITNPPYISIREYRYLSSITRSQPVDALVAKNDGYYFYQKIFRQVRNFLKNKFLLMMEIGHKQKKRIIKLIIEYFSEVKVSIINFFDYQTHSRVIAICNL